MHHTTIISFVSVCVVFDYEITNNDIWAKFQPSFALRPSDTYMRQLK